VIALCGLGAVAFVVGAASSVGRVPPWWAAGLAALGAIALTAGLLIYFRWEVGRRT
jgi:hypothetical protein